MSLFIVNKKLFKVWAIWLSRLLGQNWKKPLLPSTFCYMLLEKPLEKMAYELDL
jgi:hypothetical protein